MQRHSNAFAFIFLSSFPNISEDIKGSASFLKYIKSEFEMRYLVIYVAIRFLHEHLFRVKAIALPPTPKFKTLFKILN